MPKWLLYFLVLLMVPAFAETINGKEFLVPLPGSPFSIGRITFLFAGILGLFYNKKFYFNSGMMKGMVLIFVGTLIGALFSEDFAASVSRALGNLVLIIGSIGVASLCSNKIIQRSFDVFFIANLAYWTYYVYSLTISNGFNIVSYGKLFAAEGTINHHVIGINSSVSCIYLALRFFYKEEKLNVLGYLVVFIGILNCFLSETRSNLLITTLVLFLIVAFSKVRFTRIIFISIPVIVLMYFVLLEIGSRNEDLLHRFDASDEEYQERTTGMRIEFISLGFESFLENPFGKGAYGAEVESTGFSSTMVHNQYLSFVLSGGIIALFGVFFWLGEYVNFIRYSLRKKSKIECFNYATIISMLTFTISLFTIEFTSMLFFLYAALQIYLSEDFFVEKVKTLKSIFSSQKV